MTEGRLLKYWPIILTVMGIAMAWGNIRNEVAKVPAMETRLTRVEDAQSSMKEDLTEIKHDVKRLLRR
jgi:hypothetical protein